MIDLPFMKLTESDIFTHTHTHTHNQMNVLYVELIFMITRKVIMRIINITRNFLKFWWWKLYEVVYNLLQDMPVYRDWAVYIWILQQKIYGLTDEFRSWCITFLENLETKMDKIFICNLVLHISWKVCPPRSVIRKLSACKYWRTVLCN